MANGSIYHIVLWYEWYNGVNRGMAFLAFDDGPGSFRAFWFHPNGAVGGWWDGTLGQQE